MMGAVAKEGKIVAGVARMTLLRGYNVSACHRPTGHGLSIGPSARGHERLQGGPLELLKRGLLHESDAGSAKASPGHAGADAARRSPRRLGHVIQLGAAHFVVIP